MKKEKVAIIGLGNVGATIGHLLSLAGYEIVAVCSRSQQNKDKHRQFVSGPFFTSVAEASHLAEVVIITTQDANIARVCLEIAQAKSFQKNAKVIHMSGAGGVDMLEQVHEQGAYRACIHPIHSFANIQNSIAFLAGTVFGITCDDKIKDWCINFVHDLKGVPVMIANEDKAIYHVASCMASSYFTTLIYMVEEMYKSIGMTPEEARKAFLPLVKGTLKNIEDNGAVVALSGPIARGDVNTILQHLTSIKKHIPDLYDVYVEMGLNAIRVANEQGHLSREKIQAMQKIFSGGSK